MDEKYVAVGGVEPEKAVDHLREAKGYDATSLPNAVPKFKEVNYYSFKAEWALIGDDIQVKFFLPKHAALTTPEARQVWMKYWVERFPGKLDPVARVFHFWRNIGGMGLSKMPDRPWDGT